jgi:hypothetical protein
MLSSSAFGRPQLRPVLADDQRETRPLHRLPVEFQREALHQQVLQHRAKLALGGLGRLVGLRLDVETVDAPRHPFRTALDQLHRAQIKGDVDDVAEASVENDAAA